MALYGNAVNYAKSIDPSGANILDPGLFSGKVRVMQDYVSIAATTLKTSDYIIVGGKLPTGSQVVDIKITTDAAGTASCLLVVGDEGDDNRYLTSSLVTTNAVVVGPNVAGGMYYTVTGTTDNYIRVAGAGTVTVVTGSVIKISVSYIVE